MKRTTALKYTFLIPIGYFAFCLVQWRETSGGHYGSLDSQSLDTRILHDNLRKDIGVHHECNQTHNKLKSQSEECEMTHLLFICSSSSTARDLGLLLKTLIFYRRVPLHLHLVCDDVCSNILKTLLSTWETNNVWTSYYSIKPKSSVLYHIHDYLPSTLNKIIYLHHTVRLLSDIGELWSLFDKFTDSQFLGVVFNYGKEKIDFHNDILLLRLDLVRNSRTITESFENKLARRMIGSNSSARINHLPCSWRLDLTNISYCHSCLVGMKPQAAIWTSKSETFGKSAHVEDIKERILTVYESSPYSVSTELSCMIEKDTTNDKMSFSSTSCLPYRYASKLKRRTHLFYIGKPMKDPHKDKNDITLLTQLTLDRFEVFEKFMNNWEGPAAATFHVTDAEALRLVHKVSESMFLNQRSNIAYHVVYKRQKYYPINYLRNVAVNQTKTPFALFVDVDLVPSPGIYTKLKRLVAQTASRENVSLVVPAFEALETLNVFPKNKEIVIQYMKQKKVVGYRMNRGWNLGHKPTDFNKWQIAEEPYKVVWKDAFEPYVIVKTGDDMPRYHEGLLERMGDKIAFGREIYARGFEFWVIPDVYVIHLPHPTSEGTQQWKKESGYMRCGSILITEFKDLLKRQHPGRKF